MSQFPSPECPDGPESLESIVKRCTENQQQPVEPARPRRMSMPELAALHALISGLEPLAEQSRRLGYRAPVDIPPRVRAGTAPKASIKPPRGRLWPGEAEALRRTILNAVHEFALENNVTPGAVVEALKEIVERRFYRAGRDEGTSPAV